MPDLTPQLTTFDEQIATVRENIRELLEQQPRIPARLTTIWWHDASPIRKPSSKF